MHAPMQSAHLNKSRLMSMMAWTVGRMLGKAFMLDGEFAREWMADFRRGSPMDKH